MMQLEDCGPSGDGGKIAKHEETFSRKTRAAFR